jgi:hypothetical protein
MRADAEACVGTIAWGVTMFRTTGREARVVAKFHPLRADMTGMNCSHIGVFVVDVVVFMLIGFMGCRLTGVAFGHTGNLAAFEESTTWPLTRYVGKVGRSCTQDRGKVVACGLDITILRYSQAGRRTSMGASHGTLSRLGS